MFSYFKATGVKILDCTLIPGEPYCLKITMTSSEDASKCLKILNDTEIFGRKVKVERKERAPERDTGRSCSNSFGKELRDVSLLVDKSHSKTKGLKSTDRKRSRSRERHDKHLTSSRPHNKQKTTTMSTESKMRCKSRERNHERSRSPIKNRHRRKPSIYWDVPPFGYECLTPIQYKAILGIYSTLNKLCLILSITTTCMRTFQLKEILHQCKAYYPLITLQVLARLKSNTRVRVDLLCYRIFLYLCNSHHQTVVGNIVPESLVYKLFIDGLLNNLNQEYVSLIDNVYFRLIDFSISCSEMFLFNCR